MDILNKIERLLGDQSMTAGSGATTTANVEVNDTKGNIDIVGGECPKGEEYDTLKKVCVPIVKETSVVGGSYIGGTTVNVIGSGQTRAVGRYQKNDTILDLDRKNKVLAKGADKTRENLDRLGLRFNKILGAYVPYDLEGEENGHIR